MSTQVNSYVRQSGVVVRDYTRRSKNNKKAIDVNLEIPASEDEKSIVYNWHDKLDPENGYKKFFAHSQNEIRNLALLIRTMGWDKPDRFDKD